MLLGLVLAWTGLAQVGAASDLLLEIHPGTHGPVVASSAKPGHVLQLERSNDLVRWSEVARVHDQLHPFRELPGIRPGATFYRLRGAVATGDDDWANQLDVPSGRFFQSATGTPAPLPYVKWTLLLSDPRRIHFQDTVRHPFHIQFARARLPGYGNIGALEFNARSLHPGPSQQLVLGSVLRAPDPQVRELGIEVTGLEAFPGETVASWVGMVRDRIHAPPGWRILYLPSTGQEAEAEAHREAFQSVGIGVDSLRRWISDNVCYSEGWALGRLVRLATGEIPAALGDGRLRLGDILVTDRAPAELPVLAGYLVTEPATPNSHVALLARSLLLPFAHANGAGLQAELDSLIGREVLLEVGMTDGACRIRLTDTTGRLTPEHRAEILASKRGGVLDIVPKSTRGALTVPVDGLTPADIRFVGGKAANFGLLRRALPDSTPHPVLAITFDLWDAYLAQPLPGGGTLGQAIGQRLARHVYPPDIPSLRADLAVVRDLVEDVADFTPAQRAAVIGALQAAGLTGARIRFRSSTNVEDGDTFSGAGLYDSYSGCLEDDLDADTSGPSRCDPSEARERGVFRALRKVYASFYNENAFLERLRHQVDEQQVGMAVLVHFSVPDPLELANGVAVLTVDRTPGHVTASARIVTQAGAESVTNPDVSIRPEVVAASWVDEAVETAVLVLEETSTQSIDGAPVMTWETDYRTLLSQMQTAARAFGEYDPERLRFELDFEFKRLVPGEISLKQMRLVPHPQPVPVPTIP